jgi:hypothetical protein
MFAPLRNEPNPPLPFFAFLRLCPLGAFARAAVAVAVAVAVEPNPQLPLPFFAVLSALAPLREPPLPLQ